VPAVIGTLVSGKMAKLIELQTVYGVQDAYDMLELLTVDAVNRKILSKQKTEQ
jgi:hypothetical protein